MGLFGRKNKSVGLDVDKLVKPTEKNLIFQVDNSSMTYLMYLLSENIPNSYFNFLDPCAFDISQKPQDTLGVLKTMGESNPLSDIYLEKLPKCSLISTSYSDRAIAYLDNRTPYFYINDSLLKKDVFVLGTCSAQIMGTNSGLYAIIDPTITTNTTMVGKIKSEIIKTKKDFYDWANYKAPSIK